MRWRPSRAPGPLGGDGAAVGLAQPEGEHRRRARRPASVAPDRCGCRLPAALRCSGPSRPPCCPAAASRRVAHRRGTSTTGVWPHAVARTHWPDSAPASSARGAWRRPSSQLGSAKLQAPDRLAIPAVPVDRALAVLLAAKPRAGQAAGGRPATSTTALARTIKRFPSPRPRPEPPDHRDPPPARRRRRPRTPPPTATPRSPSAGGSRPPTDARSRDHSPGLHGGPGPRAAKPAAARRPHPGSGHRRRRVPRRRGRGTSEPRARRGSSPAAVRARSAADDRAGSAPQRASAIRVASTWRSGGRVARKRW